MKKIGFLCTVILCVAVIAATALAKVELTPKIDNFAFLLDSSGSMGYDFLDTETPKVELGKALLSDLNNEIPPLGYKGALYSLAAFKQYQGLETYAPSSFGSAINGLDTDVLTWGFIGNPTPLGKGFQSLNAALPNLQGKSAVILLSDGGSNKGVDPVKVARSMYEKYNGNLCFHIISFAETPRENAVLEQLAAISDCNSIRNASDLLGNQGAQEAFAKDVFYTSVDIPEETIVIIETKIDSDGDGVYDEFDKCPATPKDMEVDSDGCPIPITISIDIEFDTDKVDIKPMYRPEIERVVEFMKKYPSAVAVIEGHTDSVGNDQYNMGLSQRRADSVRDYMIENYGIGADRLTTEGYGETRPIDTNDTPEGRMRNRRVDAVISGAFQERN